MSVQFQQINVSKISNDRLNCNSVTVTVTIVYGMMGLIFFNETVFSRTVLVLSTKIITFLITIIITFIAVFAVTFFYNLFYIFLKIFSNLFFYILVILLLKLLLFFIILVLFSSFIND